MVQFLDTRRDPYRAMFRPTKLADRDLRGDPPEL